MRTYHGRGVWITGSCINSEGELATEFWGRLTKVELSGEGKSYRFEKKLRYDQGSTSFATSLTVPEDAVPGTYELSWHCGNIGIWDHYAQHIAFTVLTPPPPQIVAEFTPDKAEGKPGDTIIVTGQCGYHGTPADWVRAWLVKQPESSGVTYSYEIRPEYKGSDYTITAEFTIPKDAISGDYNLTWYCGSYDILFGADKTGTPFTILPGKANQAHELAETGTSSQLLVPTGALLAIGFVLLFGSRRHRIRTP